MTVIKSRFVDEHSKLPDKCLAVLPSGILHAKLKLFMRYDAEVLQADGDALA